MGAFLNVYEVMATVARGRRQVHLARDTRPGAAGGYGGAGPRDMLILAEPAALGGQGAQVPLAHPNLPELLAEGVEGELRYRVLALPAGERLDLLLARGALAEEEALALAVQVAAALEHLHRLKPPFIMATLSPRWVRIDESGRVRLNFLAVEPGMAAEENGLDPAFAAPEALADRPLPASDVYSLGALLAHLTGLTSSLRRRLRGTPTAELIERATAPDPAGRPRSLVELRAGLEQRQAHLVLRRALEPAGRGGERRPPAWGPQPLPFPPAPPTPGPDRIGGFGQPASDQPGPGGAQRIRRKVGLRRAEAAPAAPRGEPAGTQAAPAPAAGSGPDDRPGPAAPGAPAAPEAPAAPTGRKRTSRKPGAAGTPPAAAPGGGAPAPGPGPLPAPGPGPLPAPDPGSLPAPAQPTPVDAVRYRRYTVRRRVRSRAAVPPAPAPAAPPPEPAVVKKATPGRARSRQPTPEPAPKTRRPTRPGRSRRRRRKRSSGLTAAVMGLFGALAPKPGKRTRGKARPAGARTGGGRGDELVLDRILRALPRLEGSRVPVMIMVAVVAVLAAVLVISVLAVPRPGSRAEPAPDSAGPPGAAAAPDGGGGVPGFAGPAAEPAVAEGPGKAGEPGPESGLDTDAEYRGVVVSADWAGPLEPRPGSATPAAGAPDREMLPPAGGETPRGDATATGGSPSAGGPGTAGGGSGQATGGGANRATGGGAGAGARPAPAPADPGLAVVVDGARTGARIRVLERDGSLLAHLGDVARFLGVSHGLDGARVYLDSPAGRADLTAYAYWDAQGGRWVWLGAPFLELFDLEFAGSDGESLFFHRG